MTTDKETLTALLERVRAAAGPDRSIDASLFAVAHGPLESPWTEWVATQEERRDDFIAIQKFTASIDAALAWIECVLPGWMVVNLCEWEAAILRARGPWQCTLKLLGTQDDFCASKGQCNHAPAPAFAIIAAGLSALIAQAQTP